MNPKPASEMTAEHTEMLAFATTITTAVVTYLAAGDSGVPTSRGSGFFVQNGGRFYVITNTHVLERYAAGRSRKEDVRVQVWAGEGEKGSELHGGYLLCPNNKTTTEFGVRSKYSHRDVGIIELTSGAVRLAKRDRRFVPLSDLKDELPSVGAVVYYKGYPAKTAEFHGFVQKSCFGQWLEIRRVKAASQRLIVAEPSIAAYRSDGFPDEDGKDLQGISGSALIDAGDSRIVGVVWGGKTASLDAPVYAVPSSTIRHLVGEYERLNPRAPKAKVSRAGSRRSTAEDTATGQLAIAKPRALPRRSRASSSKPGQRAAGSSREPNAQKVRSR